MSGMTMCDACEATVRVPERAGWFKMQAAGRFHRDACSVECVNAVAVALREQMVSERASHEFRVTPSSRR
jgi:hypothetical protein